MSPFDIIDTYSFTSPLPIMKHDHTHLSVGDLRVVRVLGQGATGTVLLVTKNNSKLQKKKKPQEEEQESQSLLALKLVAKEPKNDKKIIAIQREIDLLSSLSPHPLLSSFMGRIETQSFVGFASEYCSGGDLHRLRRLQPDHMFSDSAIRFYAAEVILGLEELHKQGIVYRDLKPENILVKQDGHIMLSDFDLSARVAAENNAEKEKKCKSFVGTEEYMAPEIIGGKGHGFQVDWWSFGILLYEMCYGKTPFKGIHKMDTYKNIMKMPVRFPNKENVMNNLIKSLLHKDPLQRLGNKGGATEVKEHPFFAGLKWDSLTSMCRPPFLPLEDGSCDKSSYAPCLSSSSSFREHDNGLLSIESVLMSGSDKSSTTDSEAEGLF